MNKKNRLRATVMMACALAGCADEPYDVLRQNIGIDLTQVASLAVVAQTGTRNLPVPDGVSPFGTWTAALGGEGLYALTLSGEVLELSLVESSDGSGATHRPTINAIYTPPGWIFFSTMSFRVRVARADGSVEEVDCSTIAANRLTGDLFCADLGISSCGGDYGNIEPGSGTVHGNAAGDLLYVLSKNELNQDLVYKITMDADGGPVGTLVPSVLNPVLLVINATGDLFVRYRPSSIDPVLETRILPVDGGPAYTVEGLGTLSDLGYGTSVNAGTVGTAAEDTFYILDGENVAGTPTLVIHAVTRSGGSFADTRHPLTVPDIGCSSGVLHRLTGGIFMLCRFNLARVVDEAGTVLTSPSSIPLTGFDRFLLVGGRAERFTPGHVVLLVAAGSTHKFVRHDGVRQEEILLDESIDLLGFGVSPGGTIDFLGTYLDSGDKVRGTVAADSTEVTILSVEGVDLTESIAFTRIN